MEEEQGAGAPPPPGVSSRIVSISAGEGHTLALTGKKVKPLLDIRTCNRDGKRRVGEWMTLWGDWQETGPCIPGVEGCSGASGWVPRPMSLLRSRSTSMRREPSLWVLLLVLIIVSLFLMMDRFGAGEITTMDGQLGHSGGKSLVPCIMKEFCDLLSAGPVTDDSEVEKTAPLKICSVQAGGGMSAAIDNLGGLWMWGNCKHPSDNNEDSISLTGTFNPISVRGFHGHRVVNVACGNEHAVALVSAGETNKGDDLVCYSWGSNNHGQLGLGDRQGRRHPGIIELFGHESSWDVYDVACGAWHTALLARRKGPNNTPVSTCWTFGLGENGQLGHGTTQSALKPEPVKELPQQMYLVSLDCGLFHTTVVSSTGDVWSWGMEKGLGLCPDASFTGTDAGDAVSPLLIAGKGLPGPMFQDPVEVACGAAHTVLLSDGGLKLWSWGRGSIGVLGNGRKVDCFSPSAVLWPPPPEDPEQPEPEPKDESREPQPEKNSSVSITEMEKSLSSAMEEMKLLRSRLSVMEQYASILHGSIFGKPFAEQDIPASLRNSGSFDIAKEWENMLESADRNKLVRLEMFYKNMIAGVKDQLLKRRVQEMIKELMPIPSSTSGL